MSVFFETTNEADRMHTLGRYVYPDDTCEVGLPKFGIVKKLLSINNVPIHSIHAKVERHVPGAGVPQLHELSAHDTSHYGENSAATKALEVQAEAEVANTAKLQKLAQFQAELQMRVAKLQKEKEKENISRCPRRIQGTFGGVQGTFGGIQGTLGDNQGTSSECFHNPNHNHKLARERSGMEWTPVTPPLGPSPTKQASSGRFAPEDSSLVRQMSEMNRGAAEAAWKSLRAQATQSTFNSEESRERWCSSPIPQVQPNDPLSPRRSYSVRATGTNPGTNTGTKRLMAASCHVGSDLGSVVSLATEGLPPGPERYAAVMQAEASEARMKVQQKRADKMMIVEMNNERERHQAEAEAELVAKVAEERQALLEKRRAIDTAAMAAHNRSMREAAARRQRQHHKLSQHRFNKALHERLFTKVKELQVVLPSLCACPHGLSPLDEHYCLHCASNCPLYRNPEATADALGHLLHAFNVVPE